MGSNGDIRRKEFMMATATEEHQPHTTEDLEAELRRLVKSVNEMLNNRVIP